MQNGLAAFAALVIFAMAALLSASLIIVLRPLLHHYALAPNPRSSHKAPTPQGGGIAMIAATISISYAALSFLPAEPTASLQFTIFTAAVVLIAAALVGGAVLVAGLLVIFARGERKKI